MPRVARYSDVTAKGTVMYQLCFYVPESHADSVKNAVFGTGAGRIGDYECCSWQVLGKGQFLPAEGSRPFLGRVGQLESVDEIRVEMVCDDECIEAALSALLAAHPYEEPAFHYWRVQTDKPPLTRKNSEESEDS